MKEKRKILFFCMIIVANSAFGQQYTQFHQSLSNNKLSFFTPGMSFTQRASPVLPANFYCTQLGFFCKKEWKLESAIKVPIRVRLGSLRYNDWLEGKKNAGILPAN